MILNHLWGLYAHPLEEWQTIDNRHESMKYSLSHIALIALIPSIMGYISSVHIGWRIGTSDVAFLTHESALLIGVAMYFALIMGVFALAYLAHWMAVTFGAKPTYTQTLELAAYTATPLFMSAVSAVFPELWFVVTVGMAALAYSVYLLYTCLLYTSPSPRDRQKSRMPSSA